MAVAARGQEEPGRPKRVVRGGKDELVTHLGGATVVTFFHFSLVAY